MLNIYRSAWHIANFSKYVFKFKLRNSEKQCMAVHLKLLRFSLCSESEWNISVLDINIHMNHPFRVQLFHLILHFIFQDCLDTILMKCILFTNNFQAGYVENSPAFAQLSLILFWTMVVMHSVHHYYITVTSLSYVLEFSLHYHLSPEVADTFKIIVFSFMNALMSDSPGCLQFFFLRLEDWWIY